MKTNAIATGAGRRLRPLALALSPPAAAAAAATRATARARRRPSSTPRSTRSFNPSDKKGGTLKIANSGDWDSLDPGDTYYGYSWNFLRLYGRSLMMFKARPGKASNELVPDLAEGLGEASDGRQDLDVQARRASSSRTAPRSRPKDVKYAVARSTDKATFPNGPTYFEDVPRPARGLQGPVQAPGRRHRLGDRDAGRLDDRLPPEAAVRRLRLPRAAAADRCRCRKAKDTGAKYKEHVVSSGPYKFETYEPGKSFTLVRNTSWDQATDPNRKALPDKIRGQPERQRRRHRQPAASPVTSTSTSPAPVCSRPRWPQILQRPDAQGQRRQPDARPALVHLDQPDGDAVRQHRLPQGRHVRASTRPATRPPTAARSPVATSRRRCMPPLIPGYQKFDLYPDGADNKGDVDKAKAALTKCGQPNGFETNIAYRAERPKEKATAEALQQALARVGIKLTLKPYPQGDYFSAVRRQPAVLAKQQPRPDRQRLGRGLDRRLRLPVADRRQPGHPGDRRLVQPQRPDPRGRQAARPGARRDRRRPSANAIWGADRQEGHGGGRHPTRRLRQGPAAPAEER